MMHTNYLKMDWLLKLLEILHILTEQIIHLFLGGTEILGLGKIQQPQMLEIGSLEAITVQMDLLLYKPQVVRFTLWIRSPVVTHNVTLEVNTASIYQNGGSVGPNGMYAGGGFLGNAMGLQLTRVLLIL